MRIGASWFENAIDTDTAVCCTVTAMLTPDSVLVPWSTKRSTWPGDTGNSGAAPSVGSYPTSGATSRPQVAASFSDAVTW